MAQANKTQILEEKIRRSLKELDFKEHRVHPNDLEEYGWFYFPPTYGLEIMLNRINTGPTKLTPLTEKLAGIPFMFCGFPWGIIINTKWERWGIIGPPDKKKEHELLEKKIHTALKYCDLLIKEEAKEKELREDFVILNDWNFFNTLYQFNKEGVISFIDPKNRGRFDFRHEHFLFSMCIYYFAKLEVVLDACFVLKPKNKEKFSNFKNWQWKEQLNFVITPEDLDRESQRIKDEVIMLRQMRNRLVHAGKIKLFQFGNGLCPAKYDELHQPGYQISGIPDDSGMFNIERVKEIITLLASFEKILVDSPSTKYGYRLATSGFDIPLSPSRRKSFKWHTRSMEMFEKFLEDEEEYLDYLRNG